jgi:hypothetical protein
MLNSFKKRYADSRAGKEIELALGYGNARVDNPGEYVVTKATASIRT